MLVLNKGLAFDYFTHKRIFKLIQKQYAPQVFSFFMALLMSSIMSFIISIFNIGIVNGIFFIWLKAWALAFIIAFPTIILITPLVRKLVTSVVLQDSSELINKERR